MERKLQEPLNSEERYLHGINVRLNVLIEMFSSFLDVYAKENSVATTSNKIEEKVEEKEEIPNYEDMTKAELKKILDKKGIEYNARDNKNKLLELLK